MRVTQIINIENIKYGGKLPLTKKVMVFALDLLTGNIFPPINVERTNDGSYKLSNGRNRLAAHKLVGRKTIRAHVAIREEPSPDKPLACKEDEESLGINCWRDRRKACPDDGDCCNWTQGFPNQGNSYKE